MSALDDDPPKTEADIAAERVLRRIRIMTSVALMTLVAGFMSILVAIGVRMMREGNGPVAAVLADPGGKVLSAVAADGVLSVTVEIDQRREIILYDLQSLKETRRIVVAPPR